MKAGQKLWTREELILAINLYCKTPFGKLHNRNPEVINLAHIINRSPSSVAYKLVNFASLDPSIIESGRKGAENVSKLDKEIWNEFYRQWDVLPYESEKLLAQAKHSTIEFQNDISEAGLPREGKMREQLVKIRVNQNFFRKSVLASYNNTCCVTGINKPELLVAGHISQWSSDEQNRLNPRNGLALNALHDKAFEHGLFTILPDYCIKISSILKKDKSSAIKNNFLKYDGSQILLPSRFLPDVEFLKLHNAKRFKE